MSEYQSSWNPLLMFFRYVKWDYPDDIIVLVDTLTRSGSLAIQNGSLYQALADDIKKSQQLAIFSTGS